MKHPNSEQWISLLYGEVSSAEKTALNGHLDACADCRAQVNAWRGGMKALDAWPLPAPGPARPQSPWLQWAAAAALVLGLGIAIGRFTAVNPAELRASVQRDLDARLAAALRQQQDNLVQNIRAAATQSAGAETQRVLTDFAKAIEEARADDHELILTALGHLDAQRAADFGNLRKDLDTVAVLADARINRTEEQLYELAASTQPGETK